MSGCVQDCAGVPGPIRTSTARATAGCGIGIVSSEWGAGVTGHRPLWNGVQRTLLEGAVGVHKRPTCSHTSALRAYITPSWSTRQELHLPIQSCRGHHTSSGYPPPAAPRRCSKQRNDRGLPPCHPGPKGPARLRRSLPGAVWGDASERPAAGGQLRAAAALGACHSLSAPGAATIHIEALLAVPLARPSRCSPCGPIAPATPLLVAAWLLRHGGRR